MVICLPSEFTGGELQVKHKGQTRTFDWSGKVSQDGQPQIPWAFLYSDCEHEVLPVTSGHRITLTYDIYYTATSTVAELEDTRTETLYQAIDKLLKSKQFDRGTTLGFALDYSYPADRDNYDATFFDSLSKQLKGEDNAVFRALTKAGLQPECWAVYDTSYEDYDDPMTTVEKDGSQRVTVNDKQFRFDCMVARDAEILQEHNNVESVYTILEEGGAHLTLDVIWAKRPQYFNIKNSYTAYGNETELTYCYVAVAILAEIP